MPLKLYWHPGRRDNFTCAPDQADFDAGAAGYKLVRTEGYIIPNLVV